MTRKRKGSITVRDPSMTEDGNRDIYAAYHARRALESARNAIGPRSRLFYLAMAAGIGLDIPEVLAIAGEG